jgi:hypothetical protein
MASTYDYEWDQGADLTINLVYKEGPEGATVVVDLTAYKFRMDVVAPDGKVLSVLNDEAIADADAFTTGSQADNAFEVTLGSSGQIAITLSRALTLPGGAFYNYINANPSQNVFSYDMFLRTDTTVQKKILSGTITVNKSLTIWP